MEIIRTLAIALAIISCCCRIGVSGATMQKVKSIHKNVLHDYDKNVLPMLNQSAEFGVDVFLRLMTITELEETEGRMTTVMLLEMLWRDESIVWDSIESEILSITLDASLVWKPHIAVTNAHASSRTINSKDWDLVEYMFVGLAHWTTMRTFETMCDIDVTHYPFDEQRCSVELFIYGYYGKIRFRPIYFEQMHIDAYKPQGTWILMDYYISNQMGSNVTVTYHLRRDPRYMVINFLVPLLVLSFLNPVVFMIPAGSGERVGYSITIMLALSVYMTLLGDYLPQNSDPIPIMTYMIMILYILSATTLCFLFLSARVYNAPKSKPIPPLVKKFVTLVRKMFCEDCYCRRKGCLARNTYKENDDEDVTNSCLDNDDEVEDLKHHKTSTITEGASVDIPETQVVRPCKSHMRISWHSVSKSMDALFMITIYIVKILFVLIGLHVLSNRHGLERLISTNEIPFPA